MTKGKSLLNVTKKPKPKPIKSENKKTPITKKTKKVEPLIIEDKAYCPICKKREYAIIDYGFDESDSTHWFKEFCKTCNVTFKVRKYINENLDFVLRMDDKND